MSFRCKACGSAQKLPHSSPAQVTTVERPVEYITHLVDRKTGRGIKTITSHGREIVAEKEMCPHCATQVGTATLLIDQPRVVESTQQVKPPERKMIPPRSPTGNTRGVTKYGVYDDEDA